MTLYAWGSALAGAIFAAAAIIHIRHASRLSALINAHYPQLWQSQPPPGSVYSRRHNAGRLDSIVIFNAAADTYPGDPQFRALLKTARWSALLCLLTFMAAIILLGMATAR